MTLRLAFGQIVGNCYVMIPADLGVGWWQRRAACGPQGTVGGGQRRARSDSGAGGGRHAAWTPRRSTELGSATQLALLVLLCWLVLGIVLLNALSSSTPGANGTSSTSSPAPAPASALATGGSHSHSGSTPAQASHRRVTAPAAAAAAVPSAIRVLVANGTSVTGAATRFTNALRTAGYNVLSPVNSTSPAVSSVVYFEKGDRADAMAVAQFLGVGAGAVQPAPSSLPVQSSMGAMVLVMIGPDLANQAAPSAATGTG